LLGEIHAVIARLREIVLSQLIDKVRKGILAKQAPGSATAAITEQLLCASAATVVMCNRRGACACGRGLDSGFVSAIKFYRARMGLSVRGDAAGGIFSF
jgi:hypothetical protein